MNQTDEPTLSGTPKHLVGRYFEGGTKMRWDPPDPELEGPCLWSWLAPVPADEAVTHG